MQLIALTEMQGASPGEVASSEGINVHNGELHVQSYGVRISWRKGKEVASVEEELCLLAVPYTLSLSPLVCTHRDN